MTYGTGHLRFRWRDSKHNNRIPVMRLDAIEFICRFLLHVLPADFFNRNRRRAVLSAVAELRWGNRLADVFSISGQKTGFLKLLVTFS
jgi:hypothetical protein